VSGLEVLLYDTDGATPLGIIARRRGVSVSDDFNGTGGGSVTIPVADAASIAFDSVIKVSYAGTIVAAFVVESKQRDHVAADGTRWVTLSGRGLMSWLEDCVVWPQGGVTYNYSPTDRPFNYAGINGHWYNLVTWARPLGFKQSATSSGDYRYKAPKGWPDPNAYWMWATNPAATVSAGAKNWFRTTFTLTEGRKLRFYATADNYFNLYLDGALILSTSDQQSEGATWNGFATRVVNVPAGNHIIAAYVTNGASGSPGDRAGFLFSCTRLNTNGTPSTVLRHSDLTNWYVTDDEPLWYPAEMLSVILDEHRARMIEDGQISRLLNMEQGWTSDDDSNADPWVTAKALAFRCGTSGLDVLNTLVDHSIDFWVDPDTVTLHAYETRGTDRSTRLLALAKNLDSYETNSTKARKTVALVRSADGWTTATDSAGVAAYGRRESFLEFGNTKSETTAASAASRILRRTAKVNNATPSVSFTITPDAKPFIHFGCGDVITVPSATSGKATARILSLGLTEADDGTVKGSAELEVLA